MRAKRAVVVEKESKTPPRHQSSYHSCSSCQNPPRDGRQIMETGSTRWTGSVSVSVGLPVSRMLCDPLDVLKIAGVQFGLSYLDRSWRGPWPQPNMCAKCVVVVDEASRGSIGPQITQIFADSVRTSWGGSDSEEVGWDKPLWAAGPPCSRRIASNVVGLRSNATLSHPMSFVLKADG